MAINIEEFFEKKVVVQLKENKIVGYITSYEAMPCGTICTGAEKDKYLHRITILLSGSPPGFYEGSTAELMLEDLNCIQPYISEIDHEGEGAIVEMINKMGKDFCSLSRLGDRCWEVVYHIHRYNDIVRVFESYTKRSETVAQAVCGAYMEWTARKPSEEREKNERA